MFLITHQSMNSQIGGKDNGQKPLPRCQRRVLVVCRGQVSHVLMVLYSQMSPQAVSAWLGRSGLPEHSSKLQYHVVSSPPWRPNFGLPIPLEVQCLQDTKVDFEGETKACRKRIPDSQIHWRLRRPYTCRPCKTGLKPTRRARSVPQQKLQGRG